MNVNELPSLPRVYPMFTRFPAVNVYVLLFIHPPTTLSLETATTDETLSGGGEKKCHESELLWLL